MAPLLLDKIWLLLDKKNVKSYCRDWGFANWLNLYLSLKTWYNLRERDEYNMKQIK